MPTVTDFDGDFARTYIQLRTVIDGLESLALRYCLEKEDAAERLRRASELQEIVRQATVQISKLGGIEPGNCGPGMCWCNGVCVPYNCP